jgi:hypothetical protein
MNGKNYVTLGDIPFFGDFIMADDDGNVLFDSRIDGGDVPPLLTIAPVVSVTIDGGLFRFDVMTEWKEC